MKTFLKNIMEQKKMLNENEKNIITKLINKMKIKKIKYNNEINT
jgi:hypothetical protein